jgi:hypothetical protein
VSLDYIFFKTAHGPLPTRLSELQADPSYGLAEYRALAERVFPEANWESDGGAYVQRGENWVEVRHTEASMSLSLRGSGDLLALVDGLAAEVLDLGVITIDVQSSELLAPDVCENRPEYAEWYRTVVSGDAG